MPAAATRGPPLHGALSGPAAARARCGQGGIATAKIGIFGLILVKMRANIGKIVRNRRPGAPACRATPACRHRAAGKPGGWRLTAARAVKTSYKKAAGRRTGRPGAAKRAVWQRRTADSAMRNGRFHTPKSRISQPSEAQRITQCGQKHDKIFT